MIIDYHVTDNRQYEEKVMSLFTTCLIPTLLASFLYVNEPVVTMREEPTEQSKVASQAIFAEKISVEEVNGTWSKIASSDGYKGWVPSHSIIELKNPYQGSLIVSRLAAHLYSVDDTEYGPIKTLPFGTKLQALDTSHTRWIIVSLPCGEKAYIQKGDVLPISEIKSKHDLVSLSKQFLGLPYTWGGRSSFGYDCSGFVQMLYSHLNIALPRDSKDQINDHRFITVDAENLEPGDLIFFGYSKDKIRHVGMYLGNGEFIHSVASKENQPWIRISSTSDFIWSGKSDCDFPYRVSRQLKHSES